METESIAFTYKFAKLCADRVIAILKPNSDKIDLAGSVRRESDFVKDIEVVAIPHKVFLATDLFGGGNWVTDPLFLVGVDKFKKEIIKGDFNKKYVKMILIGEIVLDLFMPAPDDYYRMLAIRTGSAEYSHKVLARQWAKLGWVGTKDGLRRKIDCYPKISPTTGKIVSWSLSNTKPTLPPVWESEKDFFKWLGIRWIEPRFRK